MITQGKSRQLLRWMAVYGVLLILAFSLGIKWGAIGIAVGYTAVQYVLLIPALWIAFKETPLSINLFFKAIAMPAFCSMVMALGLLLLAYGTTFLDSSSRIGLSMVVALSVYLGIWMIHPYGRQQLLNEFLTVASVFKRAT